MEHAPLRPVPARPAGPIEPVAALRLVSSWLPTLPPDAARGLALVVLAERPRAEVATSLGVSEGELGALLAEARKELRQTVVVLGGSGWCERAESLISDRMDGVLAEGDVRRLDVHLRNCPRCVEHERRLVQATDALVMWAGGPARTPGARADAPPLVEAPPPEAEIAPPGEAAPADGGGEGVAPEEAPARPAEPVPAGPHEDQIAAAAEVLVAARTRRQIASAVAWNALVAIAILLTLAAIGLTIAGILGAEL
jgi:hypothetical protein